MLRVNGLYGWVQANDRRSVALFAGFLAALNVAAILVLYIPLLAFDPDHAPVHAWGGYAERYVPLVTLAAAGYLALNLVRHVRSVQRLVGFTFVDDADEPRLCRLVETLAIGMGLPAPYVGVIEARALNAFACGVNRRNAVVVVTRGLLDDLDDDELGTVLAHELAHIANGDIRLLAAANACLRLVGWLIRPRLRRSDRLKEVAAFPLIMVTMPPLFLFVLIVGVCAQAALRGSSLIRLLITSSREFVADARAVEATQNPAALVSALRRLDGR
ncbi:M48 family metalloprotease, partial [Methylobacterium trifolii]